MNIESITHQKHTSPNCSSGTGYSEYDNILVKYSNGEEQRIKIYTWYESKESILHQFLEQIKLVSNIDESLAMLFNSLKGYIPDSYLYKND